MLLPATTLKLLCRFLALGIALCVSQACSKTPKKSPSTEQMDEDEDYGKEDIDSDLPMEDIAATDPSLGDPTLDPSAEGDAAAGEATGDDVVVGAGGANSEIVQIILVVIKELKRLGTKISLAHAKMVTDDFYSDFKTAFNAAMTFLPPENRIAMTDKDYVGWLSNITVDTLRFGDLAARSLDESIIKFQRSPNLFEATAKVQQAVPLDQNTVLYAADKFGVTEYDDVNHKAYVYGLFVQTPDIQEPAPISHIAIDAEGVASIIPSAGAAIPVTRENFFYFFAWLIYKFTPTDPALAEELKAAQEKIENKGMRPVQELRPAVYPSDNLARQAIAIMQILKRLTMLGGQLGLDMDFITGPRANTMVKDAIDKYVLPKIPAKFRPFVDNIKSIEAGPAFIDIRMRRAVRVKQDKLVINVPQLLRVRYTDKREIYILEGVTGTMDLVAKQKASVFIEKFELSGKANKLIVYAYGKFGVLFFEKRQDQNVVIDFATVKLEI